MEKETSTNEQERQALVISLRLLAATPKSRKLLQKKLEEKGFREEVIERTLDHLEKQGFLNDRALAQGLLQGFTSRRPSGRKRIAYELKNRGIGGELIEELLEKYPPEEEREKALELAKQKQERWRKLDLQKRRKKTYDLLVRRGFDFSLSREVVSEVVSESA